MQTHKPKNLVWPPRDKKTIMKKVRGTKRPTSNTTIYDVKLPNTDIVDSKQ